MDTHFYGRRLSRSNTQKWVGGVLSGIGETYGINITLLRILFVASILLPGPQVLLYIIAWFIMPKY
ncbi:PspC domain-containing protein [Corynebacterium pseudotuberculosis]|uniref:PspC domain-containing protein n=3 Tax=Corynebacterium pseudotuberculosis TaxID=1719 RepID=D9Q9S9_CORP2|nr:PspC domain-containing protein [Corynebacterium pseudotuberculosis]AER68885.1 Phage shock protein C [Corynebacterium pseudotuberculosis 1/06-A]ADK28617.2 PspC domain-containing protein [Corynebacterium pseudotuberculosis FRC41]ADL10305.2 PspC domain-containing protein [Corynebacterium pseudotuberculosis C231]ADL20710.1 PspC domain-containing protein [Corynebacterium pseudotuberculosis 1002]ADO26097.2 PspC domain-containing protein [Corynebacterium pseudotuberculosis I19]